MLVKNMGDGLVNGSMGSLHSFHHSKSRGIEAIYVKFDDVDSGIPYQVPERDNAVKLERSKQQYKTRNRSITRIQFPLIPSWAVTVHKAQGMSVDSCVLSFSKIFAHGKLTKICKINKS